jgi:hypothetical protein
MRRLTVPRPSPSSPPRAPLAGAVPLLPVSVVAPLIRERLETLDLEDDDIVESAPQPVRRSSAPPPPLPLRRSSAPPPPPASVPAPPVSTVRATSIATPLPGPRPSAPDPTDVLFDGLYELNFVQTLEDAATLCAASLGAALGARVVVVHAHDLTRRELRAVAAHGAEQCGVVGSTEPSDDDLVAAGAICNEAPITMRFDGELPRVAPRRLSAVGAPRTVLAVPAMAWGRCLGVIEVIDADERFAARAADAAMYVAERFAEFLSHRVAA